MRSVAHMMAAKVVIEKLVMVLHRCVLAIQTELQDPLFPRKSTVSTLIQQLTNLLRLLNTAFSQQIVPDSGCASTLAATDAATPITYPPRDCLHLIHECLLASGMFQTASVLFKEVQLEPLPSLVVPSSLMQQPSTQEAPPVQHQWPSGRAPGFLSKKLFSANDMDTESEYKTRKFWPSSPVVNDYLPNNPECIILDSLVVHYLKDQDHQGQTPITTLPPLSLLHQRVSPEPKRSIDVLSNITSHLATREFTYTYGEAHGKRRDRQFVYSQFRESGISADVYSLTCITFLGDTSFIAVGNDSGDLKLMDSTALRHHEDQYDECHRHPVIQVQSFISGDTQLLLSSSSQDVKLWDVSSYLSDQVWDVYENKIDSFYGCKAAKFSHSGTVFAALSTESAEREILLYDIQTGELESMLSDDSTTIAGQSHLYSLIHFSDSDTILLWNGILWDRRVCGPVHRFYQFTDFGGGGFHPSGYEVIMNSEVWDLRTFTLLHSVPSLDKTTITFNANGDVIYAILRRNVEDVMSAFHTWRAKHPLFSAFRTVDAVNYSDIATTPVDHTVLDFTTEPTDSFVGLVSIAKRDYGGIIIEGIDEDDMWGYTWGYVEIYEIGHRKKPDEDSGDTSK